jgi:hypothetical protein
VTIAKRETDPLRSVVSVLSVDLFFSVVTYLLFERYWPNSAATALLVIQLSVFGVVILAAIISAVIDYRRESRLPAAAASQAESYPDSIW